MLSTPERTSLSAKAKLFRGFSDPSRLSILEAMLEGPKTVGEIVQITGMSQPNVSGHLSCLRDCGLVVARQQGQFVICQLSDERVRTLISTAGSLLADVARGVYECTRYEA